MQEAVRDRFQDNYSVGHAKTRQPNSANIHFHEDMEFYLLIRGAEYVLVDEKVFPIQPLDFIVIQPNQIHQMVRNRDAVYERHIMVAKTAFLDSLAEDPEVMQSFYRAKLSGCSVVTPSLEERKALLKLLNEFYKADGYAKKTLQKAKFTEILVLLSRMVDRQLRSESEITVSQKIQPVLSCINDAFSDPGLRLEQIAARCHISKPYLCELFKKYTSMTVNSYILNKRLLYAKKLLSEGEYNVTECALMAGFADYSNFIRVFKRCIGTTPKQYQIANCKLQIASYGVD